jgi:N-acetylmuramoyl-L-alanine amidase
MGKGNGSLFFYNPKTAVSDWIFSREVTVTIGNHRFAR